MTNAPEPAIVAWIREQLKNGEPVQEDDTDQLLDAYGDVVNQRDAELAARNALRQAYELKVQDLAAETNRLGKLIDAVKAEGHRDYEDCRTRHCGICRALRELDTAVILPRVNVRRPWQSVKGKADRG